MGWNNARPDFCNDWSSDEKYLSTTVSIGAGLFPICAAPFVVSDPYPPDAAQPTEFVISVSGTQVPVIIPATATSQGVIFKGMSLLRRAVRRLQ